MEGCSKKQEGQSLVLILVVLVVGAIIAFAIAARTIQDIRRTGEERTSNQAATQVETVLDVITSSTVWTDLWTGDAYDTDVLPDCTDPNRICCVPASVLEGYLDDVECDELTVCIRLEADIVDKYIEKDDVFEINLSRAANPDSFNILWTPDLNDARMIVKVYQANGEAVVLGPSNAYKKVDDSDWGQTGVASVSYTPGTDLFVRIRAVGSGMTIGTEGAIPPQDLSVRATCNIAGIYREFVRSVPLYSFLPACFDYVLFDGSTMVEDFETF